MFQDFDHSQKNSNKYFTICLFTDDLFLEKHWIRSTIFYHSKY